MAESAAAPVTALAVISGTLPEKVQAFQQIASAAPSLMFPGGYDTPAKVMAACWGADALQIHPVTYMNGVHAMPIRGRIVPEPRWEFMLGLVESRLPNFRMKVEKETEAECRIWFSNGRIEYISVYTSEDADRQGHTTGPNAETWRKNRKEMVSKTCKKRGIKMVAAAVLMGLPPGLDDYDFAGGEATVPGAAPGSEAKPPARVSAAEEPGAGAKSPSPQSPERVGRPGADRPQSGAEEVTAHTALSLLLDDLYGAKLSRARRLEKCGLVMGLIHGGPARVYKRADEIGPADAQAIYDYLIERYPERKPVVGGEAGSVTGDAADAKPPAGQDDDAPPATTAPTTDDMGNWTAFMTLVLRCRKEMQREVLGKGIKDERKLYVIDLDILNAAGVGNAAVLVRDAEGTVTVPPDQLRAFSYAMSALLERNAKPEYARTP